MFTQWQPGVISVADFDGGAFHRSREITREHVQEVLRRVSGTDVTRNELKLASTCTDRSYQATTYRKGRVLLAGDAAHIHSPLGGQGLNLGLGDAMNLGWKLAATVRGDSPEGLLDSYTEERRRGHRPRPDRHAGRRDLLRGAGLERVPALRPRERAPARRPQRAGLRAGRRPQARRNAPRRCRRAPRLRAAGVAARRSRASVRRSPRLERGGWGAQPPIARHPGATACGTWPAT